MKILMISTLNLTKQNGGTVHFSSLAKGFRKSGHQVDALLVTTGDPEADQAITTQLFEQVTFSSNALSHLIPLSKTTVNSLGQVLATLQLNPQHYDWVYFRSTPFSLAVLWTLRLKGFQKIFVEHNGWFADELVMMGIPNLFRGVLAWLQTLEAHQANQLRVVVPGIAEQLKSHSKQPETLSKYLVVIGNGADIEHYHPLEREQVLQALGLAPEKFYLGFIGDLDPWQGVGTALEATALIRKQHPQVEILVVGSGRQLELLKQGYADKPYVHFLGTVPYGESNRYINCFDLALLPKQGLSRIGYSPIKLYTYAAAGRCILASRIRGLEEYGGQNGFLTLHTPGNKKELANAACHLIRHDYQRKQNGQQARNHAEKFFSWDRVAQKILQTMQNYDHRFSVKQAK